MIPKFNRIYQGDNRKTMSGWPDAFIHCAVTSPPYWGLRDYGVAGQLGLEKTPQEYVENMVKVFREVRRVLREDGTLWLNLGDSYNAAGRQGHGTREGCKQGTNRASAEGDDHCRPSCDTLKPKDLVGIPWRVAFALQADGWYLRQDIIWHKPNPMPESVEDRCTKAHEYIFLLAKSEQYYYDADAIKEISTEGFDLGLLSGSRAGEDNKVSSHAQSIKKRQDDGVDSRLAGSGYRNKRSVWTVITKPFKEAHFATFPDNLIIPCILAGTSEHGVCSTCGAPWERVFEKTSDENPSAKGSKFDSGKTAARYGGDRTEAGPRFLKKIVGWRPTCEHGGNPVPAIVLDPFSGAGTTALVSLRAGRHFLGCELNPEYIKITQDRLSSEINQGKLF